MVAVEDVVERRLKFRQRGNFMFKLKRSVCTNCRLCMIACTSAHNPGVQSVNLSRVHIEDNWPEASGINVCVPCKDHFCIAACPEDALSWDGHVVLDKEKCTSCGACVPVCPFGGVQSHPDGSPLICDTCDGAYSCTQICPTKAISRS